MSMTAADDDADLLPISALQHLLFCERQAALIYIEQLWAENELTVQGQQLHKKADAGRRELLRGRSRGVRAERGVYLRSLRLGLWGRADVVEYPHHPIAGTDGAEGCASPVPIEYKCGKPKRGDEDAVQLCAQGIALEEMHGVAVPAGAIFYGETRDRLAVPFDDRLRRRTIEAAGRLRAMIDSGQTPLVAQQPKCKRCSLIDLCRPDAIGRTRGQRRSAAAYVERTLAAAFAEVGEEIA